MPDWNFPPVVAQASIRKRVCRMGTFPVCPSRVRGVSTRLGAPGYSQSLIQCTAERIKR